MAVLSGEHRLASFFIDSLSPYVLFNTIPPCPTQTEGGEGTAAKKEEWSGGKVINNNNNLYLIWQPRRLDYNRQ